MFLVLWLVFITSSFYSKKRDPTSHTYALLSLSMSFPQHMLQKGMNPFLVFGKQDLHFPPLSELLTLLAQSCLFGLVSINAPC